MGGCLLNCSSTLAQTRLLQESRDSPYGQNSASCSHSSPLQGTQGYGLAADLKRVVLFCEGRPLIQRRNKNCKMSVKF